MTTLLPRRLAGLLWCASAVALFVPTAAMAQSANCYPSTGTSYQIIGSGSGDLGAALESALNAPAPAGRHILVKAGNYTDTAGITRILTAAGTEANPIVIKPESGIGSVTINNAHWTMSNSGSWLVIEGLFFESSHLRLNGDHCRITRCRFRTIDEDAIRVGDTDSVGARDCRIDHCDFSDVQDLSSPQSGCAIKIRPIQFKTGISARLLIDYCDFHDMNPTQGWDYETVSIYGTPGALELARGTTVFLDHCRFYNIHIPGQGEIVPVKIGGWVTRFCTFEDIGTYYSHRGTRGSEVRSSWFEAMTTISVRNWGPDHLFIGNRFLGSMKMGANVGNATWSEVLALSGDYAPSTNNTFIGNRFEAGRIDVGGYWTTDTQNDPAAYPADNNLFEANTRDNEAIDGLAAENLIPIKFGVNPAHTNTTVNATTSEYYVPAVKLTASDVGLYAPDPLCSGGLPPVAHWQFNETTGTSAADSSGNANTGTLTNFSGTYWVAGQLGNGLNFDGANDVVDAGSVAGLDNLPALTVAAWIKADSLGGDGKGRIVNKGTGNGPTAGWLFALGGTNGLSFVVDYGTTNLTRTSAANAIGSTLGVWKHVVATWTGSATATNAKIYVDGVEVSYGTTTNGVGSRANDGASTVYIGNTDALNRGFDGVIDDVRVYNYALTASQVQALYQSGGVAVPTGLTTTAVAYNQINLSWTDVANETGYKVERKKGTGGTYTQIGTAGAGATTYNDTTAGAGTAYYYRVRAYNSAGNSGYSNEAGATTSEITSGRVAHWKLNETSGTNANDETANNNDGTLAASPATPTWVAGKINNGLNFDGADDRVNAGSGSSLDNLSAMTLSAWIKPDTLGEGGKGRIVDKSTGTTPNNGWLFDVDGTDQLSFIVDYTTTNLQRSTAVGAIAMGAWQHVLVTWTGSATATNIKFYINGVETAYGTTNNGIGTRVLDGTANVSLGNDSTGARTFDGVLDDVRVYNRVLTAAEITAIHRAGEP